MMFLMVGAMPFDPDKHHRRSIRLKEYDYSQSGLIHGIVSLSNVGAQFIAPFRKATTEKQGVINHAPTVGEIFRAFKARCTHALNQIRNTPGLPLWQRNFYEHIIRSEDELNRTRQYIRENPVKWESDEENILRPGARQF